MEEKHSKVIGRSSRRNFIKTAAVIGTTCSVSPVLAAEAEEYKVKGRINQSVCKWCFGSIPMEEFAAYVAKIGIKAIDLVGPSDWPILKKHGLVCSMSNSHGIVKGLNRKENHEECLAKIRKSIEETADAGFPNVICFSGNRKGMDDDEGMKNCEIAVKQIVGLAEQKKINLCIELLNSKRNHKDYMCDRTHWGAELVKRVGSPRFKLLYDIYHMQVQEGDVIATIKEYAECIAHYHTAGVPGRHEIDDSQELNYPPIMKAIAETGFDGYVAQEFIPKRDPLTSLAESVRICDV
jgi:hydroxypyruvate isomerase